MLKKCTLAVFTSLMFMGMAQAALESLRPPRATRWAGRLARDPPGARIKGPRVHHYPAPESAPRGERHYLSGRGLDGHV